MKIRENHPILDRVKVLIILLLVAWVLGRLAEYTEEKVGKPQSATIEALIRTAIKPVGSTMYIWGGGWDEEDSKAGASSTQIGLSPKWKVFADAQTEEYDFKEHRFERENGLDCSGYVGWVVYNTFERSDGHPGYVIKSTEMAQKFADRGWGKCLENPDVFLPGDIVSMDGHVWISLGTCADGSVLLAHSSPPGVSICGTQLKEDKESIAIQLATEYMTEKFPKWQEKYPNRGVPETYLENVTVMRWNSNTMSDAEVMREKSGEEIMKLLKKDKM